MLLFLLGSALALAIQGDPAFVEAQRLYDETEYEQAGAKLDEISKRPGLDDLDKAQVLLWLGLSYAGAGDLETARATLKSASLLDANLELPPRSSPSIVKLFEQAKAEADVERPSVAEVEVPAPTPPPTEKPSLFMAGVGIAAAGGVALVAGGVLAVLTAGSLATAQDPEQFQLDAKAALDAANAEALGAAILLPVGAAAAIGGGVLIAMDVE